MYKVLHILIIGLLGCFLHPMFGTCISFISTLPLYSESVQIEQYSDTQLSSGEIKAIENDQSKSEGILQNSIPLSRILSTRNNNRVNTIYGRNRNSSDSQYKTAYGFHLYKLKYKTIVYTLLCGLARQETSPFVTSASCHYYVFALRRILC